MASGRSWRHFDYILLGAVILLTVLGIVVVYSANLGSPDEDLRELWRRQATFAAVGVGLIVLLAAFPRNYEWLGDFWWLAYLLAVVLLSLVLVFGGSQIGDVRGWFNLGFVRFQPSFLAMSLITVSVGAVLSRPRKKSVKAPLFGLPRTSITQTEAERPDFFNYLASILMMLVLAGLVFQQPDMGTAMVLVTMWLIMLLVSEANPLFLVLTGGAGVLSVYPLWKLVELIGFKYMQDRVRAFLFPQANQDVAYQLKQAFIAIGSGGFWGKGLGQGTQSQLRYLPVRHTDFVFAVIAEELGFLGVMVLFCLYLVVFWRLLRIMLVAPDSYGRLLVAGTLAMILFQFFVNVGMNLGLLPVVGLPLPLISYGPAALLTTAIGIGIAENVAMHRKKLEV